MSSRTEPAIKRAKPPAASADVPAENLQHARDAGLRYICDTSTGVTRRKAGKSFKYVQPNGKAVTDPDTLIRIKALAIPPAWQDVWICPVSNGHMQAVGRDAKGRKQYRYHADWRKVRDEDKYGRMISFVKALPDIRRRVKRDLALRGMPREKVLAAVIRLLETTYIRIGNDEYKRTNQSYGLTTMLNRHVKVKGAKVDFRFRGKSGVDHAIDLEDPKLAKIIRACQDLPGEELFAYVDDDGQARDIGSADVNEYLRDISGQSFTAKDFRTWAGTVLAARALREMEAADSQAGRKKNLISAVESVAKKLGNTRAVCRKCYIHPAIIESYLGESFRKVFTDRAEKLLKSKSGLRDDESAVLALLRRALHVSK